MRRLRPHPFPVRDLACRSALDVDTAAPRRVASATAAAMSSLRVRYASLMPVIAAGPDWASITTAIGTVVVAAAAVGIAIWGDRQTGRRLQEERQCTQDAEQLGEAYAVQVTLAKIPAAELTELVVDTERTQTAECPVVVVVNNGRFTITNVDVRFTKDSAVYPWQYRHYYSSYTMLPKELQSGLVADPGIVMLPPGVAGMRFIGNASITSSLSDMYPIVRWTDRWTTRWEHRQGDVRQIDGSAEWRP